MRALFLLLLLVILTTLACNFHLGELPSSQNVQSPGTTIAFIAPALNSVIQEGASITLAVKVKSETMEAARVEFLHDSQSLGTVAMPADQSGTAWTARLAWQAFGARGHFLSAVAKRADGSPIASTEITIQVAPIDLSPDSSMETGASLGSATPDDAAAAIPTTTPLRAGVPTNTPGGSNSEPVAMTPISGPAVQVLSSTLTLRSGPGSTFTVLATMSRGDQAAILGRNGDRTWWFVEWGAQRGWVTGNTTFVAIQGDTTDVPFVTTDSTPQPSVTPVPTDNLVPTSTVGPSADLVIDNATFNPATPLANQTFSVTVLIRNQGVIDAPSSLLSGLFQPGNERSEVAVPAIRAGETVTVTLYVTLQQSGSNQVGALLLDVKGEVSEGSNGEANNVRTLTYNVN